MVYSIYEELTSLTTASTDEVKAKLAELNLATLFRYLYEGTIIESRKKEGTDEVEAVEVTLMEKGWLRPVVMYAAYTYSWESKMVTIGRDWLRQKMAIAQKVFLPTDAYEAVVHLKDQKMSDAFMDFLYLYRDNMDYVHMTSLKEMYQQIMSGATKIKEGTNLEDKWSDMQKGNKLRKEIQEIEDELSKKYEITQMQGKDFKERFNREQHINPLFLENSPLIIDGK